MSLTRKCRDVHDGETVILQQEICSSSLLTLKVVMKRNFANLKELAPNYEKYRAFSLTWPGTMQIYRNERKVLPKKRLNSRRIGLQHQDDRRYILIWETNMAAFVLFFEHQYGGRDVM